MYVCCMLVCGDFIYTLDSDHHAYFTRSGKQRQIVQFVWLYAGILLHCGDHRAHFTRSDNQSEIVWSSHPRVLHGEVHV